MLTTIIPKLPMRDKERTRRFYLDMLGFEDIGVVDFDGYLILRRDHAEIHFFAHPSLDVSTNYGQVYVRVNEIEALYNTLQALPNVIHPAGHLRTTPWGQREFAVLDPDNNLLTFGIVDR